MDNHAFTSLAHVRILLIPIGSIPQASFEKYAAEIRSFETIRLGDIPADAKGEKARFMPNPLSPGHLHLSFPTHPPSSSHSSLSLLRPSHFPLGVIGVASCSQANALSSIYSQFNAALLDIFPATSLYPLARNCFVFEENDNATNLNAGEGISGLVVLPSMMGNKKLYIGTLVADLCSQILGEFGAVIQALESPLGNEYLNASLLPTLPPLSEIPTPLNADNNAPAVSISSFSSQPDVSRLSLGSAASLKRNSSAGPNYRQSTLSVQASKKRLSTVGTTSSHARLYKVLGDFFLLAGRTEDSNVWYTEAVQLFKNSQDNAWHASALEGLATLTIIEAWSAGHGLHSSTTATKEPWSDIIDKLTQATNLYQKSPLYYEGETNYALLSYLYSCCVLRHCSLLYAIWSAKGWGPLAFTTMLHPGPAPYLPPTLDHDEADQWLNLERLSKFSGISRSTVSGVLSQLHGPWLLHIDSRERLSILEAMASMYACLGYKRKEAYVLREVLGCVMDLMVCGREEDGITKVSAAHNTGIGVQNGSTTPPGVLSGAANQGAVGIRMSESSLGNDSVLKLLRYVCRILGIDLDAVKLVDAPIEETSQQKHETATIFDDGVTLAHQEPHGWPELQVGVIREAVAVAEALPDFPAVAQFSLSSLKNLQAVLSSGDQHHLYSTSIRALMTARRRGDLRSVEYWSGRPIISITLAPVPLIRLPVEKHRSVLQRQSSGLPPILQGITDPFLYNPRRAAAKKDREIVAQNETLEFLVVLQNPLVFDLELQSLSLSTSGVEFQSQPVRVMIPANSFHQVILSGKALNTGILTIRGCFAQAAGGVVQEFILPLRTDEEEEKLARKKSAIACEAGRFKYSGLESFPWERARKLIRYQSSQLNPRTDFRFLECKVVHEQPLLRIRRTSVNHGALMLYEGERSMLRMTLENISSLLIDFVHLAFEDSTMEPAQQALTEGELSVFDTYETEYSLINQPVFTWNKCEARPIQPRQTLALNISCLGKAGCINGTIHVSYSFAHRTDLGEPSDYFYTRQISYPIMVTVYPMLQCQNMDLIPFPSYREHVQEAENVVSRYHLDIDDGTSWCLFSVEVRNMYGSPFEVTFEREGTTDIPQSATTVTLPPGSTSRVILPLKRISLSEKELSEPIPTLSDRQFVVAKAKLSEAELQLQRELFWYREALFKKVRGRWKEAGGIRTGEISLRQQRMTLPMLESFRLEIARVELSLKAGNGGDGDEEEGKRHLKSNEFVDLNVKITNLSSSSLPLVLSVELEPSDCLVYEGAISDIPVGRLSSGASRTITIPVCFLTDGQFELVALVRPVGIFYLDTKPARGQFTVTVRS